MDDATMEVQGARVQIGKQLEFRQLLTVALDN